MIIKNMRASFGKLESETLILNDGLNIITLPNEAGKSTWSAFICAMLYGVDTSERDKKDMLSAKNKYRPWSGAPMEGSMECVWRGKPVTLTRSTKNPLAPMQDFSAVYTDTGEPVEGLSGTNAGEMMLGIGLDTFLRTVFITQSGMVITKTPELERRIQSLFSTGEEHSSYTEADSRLREWQRSFKHNRNGRIPVIESDIEKLNIRLSRMNETILRFEETTGKLFSLREQKNKLSKEADTHTSYDINAHNILIHNAKTERDAAAAELRETEAKLSVNGTPPSPSELRAALRLTDDLKSHESAMLQAKSAADKCSQNVSALEISLLDSPFAGLDGTEAWNKASAAADSLKPDPKKPVPVVPFILLCVLFIAAISLCTIFISGTVLYYILAAFILVFIILSLIIFLPRRTGVPSAVDALERDIVVSQFKTSEPSEIIDAASKYRTDYANLMTLKTQKEELSGEYEALRLEFESQKSEILRRTEPFIKTASSIETIKLKIADFLELHAQADAIKHKLDSADKFYESLVSSVKPDTIRAPDFSMQKPPRDKEQVTAELRTVTLEISRLENELSMLSGSFSALGNPDVLRASLDEQTELKKTCEFEYSALELCISELASANNTLRERFSPLLNERAGEIMNRLTGGRYKKIKFDRNFCAVFELSGDVVERKAPFMSLGSYEQLYLALRLAVCDIALGGDSLPPLILDDALVYFDDERMKSALSYLKSESKKRQIILFTCQSRESDYAAKL